MGSPTSAPGGQAGEQPAGGVTAGTTGMMPDAQAPAGGGFYQLERLDRGLVAVSAAGGNYVGFRLTGAEYNEGSALDFVLLRDGMPIAELSGTTNYLDSDGGPASRYAVQVRRGERLEAASGEVTPWDQPYLSIPLSPPSDNYSANDASAADLDGDGAYELILKWEPNNAQDNSKGGVTDVVYLDALRLNGERLWRIDLGPNIRAGAHYTQFIAYDLDGDGRAELAVKTAPGTRDGRGEYLTLGPAASDDDQRSYRNGDGYVLSGPEYLTVFDGLTGAERATVAFEQARGDVGAWGDNYGNRVDRFLATAAYLDDSGLASFVMARGYYTRTTLTAWNFRDEQLTMLWKFDSDRTPRDADGNPFSGQGAHSLSVANVDDDPQQEIVYGAMTVDHDGRGMCSTGFGHGDALHVSDFLPERAGMESFMPHEEAGQPAWSLRDAGNCEIISRGARTDADVGRGVAAEVDLDSPGAEFWASSGINLTSMTSGRELGIKPPSINFLAYWDALDDRELVDANHIQKVDGREVLRCDACVSNNGTKSTPTLVADLLGDYREEVIWRMQDNRSLRLFTTTDLAERRLYTLMHDAQYRVAVSFQNVAYNQPAHPSFSLAEGMVPKADLK